MKTILKDLRNAIIGVIIHNALLWIIAYVFIFIIHLLRKLSIIIMISDETAGNMDIVVNLVMFFVISFLLVVKNKHKLVSIIAYVSISLFVSFLFCYFTEITESSLSSIYIYITVIAPYVIYKSYHYIKRCKLNV